MVDSAVAAADWATSVLQLTEEHPLGAAALAWGLGCSAILAVCDARTRRIPNLVVIPALAGTLGLLIAAVAWTASAAPSDTSALLIARVTTALVAGAAFSGLHLVAALSGGLGGGDVKLALLLGTLLGFTGGWSAVWWGGALGWSIAGCVVLMSRASSGRGAELPFAPCLVAATWIVIAVTS